MPSHVEKIAAQYPESLGFQAKDLVRKHTLWPVYAPFIPDERRKAIEEWMVGEAKGAAHLATGIAASRVPAKQAMLLCETCKDNHERKYGETFWDRRWQVPLVNCCPLHGSLSETDIKLNGEHRHAYISPSQCKIVSRASVTKSDIRFAELACRLFDSFTNVSPSYQQWTLFYQSLAIDHDFLNGRRIDHQNLLNHYIAYWSKEWLNKNSLLPPNRDTSWLKNIFRKHRKAFSFAEHLSVIEAVSQGKTQIGEAIEQALSFQAKAKVTESKAEVDIKVRVLNKDQNAWLALLVEKGPKGAREVQPALYARLYRDHYHWLMDVNEKYQLPATNVNNRVEWSKRDRESSRTLLKFIRWVEADLFAPRITQTFLIHQLTNRATIEKNLHRLPRCAAILERYTESVDEYQIRRLTRAFIALSQGKQTLKRWVLLREAGLSKERMSRVVERFLKEILRDGK